MKLPDKFEGALTYLGQNDNNIATFFDGLNEYKVQCQKIEANHGDLVHVYKEDAKIEVYVIDPASIKPQDAVLVEVGAEE